MGGRPTSESLRDFSRLVSKCYNYLFNNFHKFNQTQKIEIAKAVIIKAMPQKVEGDFGAKTNIIIVRPNGEKVETDSKAISRQVPVQH